MPMSTDVPPPTTPESLLDKTSALAIKLREYRTKKSESKAARSRQMLALAEGGASASATMSVIPDLSGRRARRAERRARKGLVAGGARTRRLRAKVAKADRRDYISGDNLVWVVLFNADQGESVFCLLASSFLSFLDFADIEIEGRELADSKVNIEKIDVSYCRR